MRYGVSSSVLPGRQDEHALLPSPVDTSPTPQMMQKGEPDDAANWPSGHAVQELAPSFENDPAAHAEQLVMPFPRYRPYVMLV